VNTPTTRRYDALMAIATSIARHRDLSSLFRDLSDLLRPLVGFDFLIVVLYNAADETLTEHTLVSSLPNPPHVAGTNPIDQTGPWQWVIRTQQSLVIDDVLVGGNPPAVQKMLEDSALRAVLLLPLTTAVRPIGGIGLGSVNVGAYATADLEFLTQVAKLIATAVDNALHSEEAERQRVELARERDRWRVLLEVNNALVSTLDLQELLTVLAPRLRDVIPFDAAFIALQAPAGTDLRLVAREIVGGPSPPLPDDVSVPIEGTALGRAFSTRQPLVLGDPDWDHMDPAAAAEARRVGIRRGCAIPLVGSKGALGAFIVATRNESPFSSFEIDLLNQVGAQMAIAIENALSYQRIADLSARLRAEKQYLENEIRVVGHFEHIIGASAGLRQALAQVETVAGTDSTVLILGETGTGKELVARAIHDASPRKGRTFVRVNCAAIPSGLLESELFGHERGAFTGALMRKIGRFELADGGTILLDEIGDIPLELQPKLLRVLQEHEFERLGNSRSTKVDVRVVASTNRDLQAMVDAREFRADLYYRLNVFPITLPALRDRADDIPALVQHFVERHARRLKRSITRIPSDAMAALQQWTWPGNVRELENVIERAVILSRGEVLEVPLPIAASPGASRVPVSVAPSEGDLESIERAHILKTLRAARWVIGGPSGAASRLGMKRTTLTSRMRKLGIARPVPD
jgi:formate hydrogenlyase transcriptional activator